MSRYNSLKQKHLLYMPEDQDWLIQHKRLLKGASRPQSGYTGNDPMALHQALMRETSINSRLRPKRFAIDLSA